MRICVSIIESNIEGALASAKRALRAGADLLEIRFDHMNELPRDLSPFRTIPAPKIATLRPVDHGGKWNGDEDGRLSFLKRAMEHFQMVDVELGTEVAERINPPARIRVICSYHDFRSTPSPQRIVSLLEAARDLGDVPKAAFMVNGPEDLLHLEEASRLEDGDREEEKVLLGMGDLGSITRMRADLLGSAFTYASLSEGLEAAPGQIDIETMKWLGENPVITGITGFPLSHSLSPPMHNAAFKHLGIPGIYLTFPAEEGELSPLTDVIRRYGIRGMNVTIPHKEAIMEFLDSVDGIASKIGAVNTVVNDGSLLRGTNTDVVGIRKSFENAGMEVREKKVLVLGAGGAARSCCAFLCDAGAEVMVVNRTPSRALKLERDFPCVRVITEQEALEVEFDAVVNCTPLGMRGFPDVLPVTPEVFRRGQFVMDTVYNPPITRFMDEARKRGAKVLSGIEMLIYQAIAAFEIWTGSTPPYEVMARTVRERLE